MAKSAVRQEIYKEIYKLINNNKLPLKIPQACACWLSVENALSRIFEQ